MEIPELVFIIPYRDRPNQKKDFLVNMNKFLKNNKIINYEFLLIEQNDDRLFNRGAMKNLGFLFVKSKFPDNYKDINLIFNDIDTYPNSKDFIDYRTSNGNLKHFFGFSNTLGGILSVKGGDFQKCGGFPNLWGWGYEDNELKIRVDDNNINIDRTQFFDIKSSTDEQISMPTFHNSTTNPIKMICERSHNIYLHERDKLDGIDDIQNYDWEWFQDENLLKINKFECKISYSEVRPKQVDLRKVGNVSKPRMDSFRKNWNNIFKF